MSKFGTKEELVKAIESHFSTMQHGKLSMEDLEMLVEQSRELYERVLVLRYKAYEEKIFGDKSAVVEAKEVLDSSENQIQEEHTDEAAYMEDELPQDDTSSASVSEDEEEEIAETTSEEAIFDFSLFDEPKEESPFVETNTNDSNMDITAEEEFLEEETEPEAVSLEEPTILQEEINAVEFTNPISSFDEKASVEQETSSASVLEEEDEENLFVEAENESLYEEEQAMFESEGKPVYETGENDIFKSILKTEDGTLGSRMMQSRLDTLLGAFGFNEKFQYIQELFNGSSDDFNQAIDVLDNLHSFGEAKEQLHYYVRLNNWDLDSDITGEFVRKIERRFK